MIRRSAVFVAAVASTAAIAAFVACTTPDPRAGNKNQGGSSSSSSSSTSSSSSGGVDASNVTGPIDCGPMPGAAGAFDKKALLGAAAKCSAWHACGLQNAATALRDAARAHAAAPTDATRDAARAAWKTAMTEQSKMELFRFGPAGNTSQDPYHGRGLRSFVHPWPDTNRCQVETQVASKEWQKGIDLVLPSARGLFALEYVFFYGGADTVCLPGSPTGQTWSSIAPADLAKAKADYGLAVAENVLGVAVELRNVWQPAPGGEDFGAKLLAFDGYGSEQEALNVVAWSLLYEEKEIKDTKVAPRAGVVMTPPIPETPFALVEIENIRTNLRAFRALFQGCSADGTGIGFDDWLIAAGQGQLANEILTAMTAEQAAVDAFPPFDKATEQQFADLYGLMRTLAAIMKTRFFGSASPLNLKLPAGVASDTD